MKKIKNRVALVIDGATGKVLGAVAVSMVSASANATGVDVTSLTTSVDMSSVITAILAVAATMSGVYVAWKAAKMVIAAVRGL